MSHPYDYAIDPNGDATANKVLRLVGRDCRVLELGTAGGVMTRELQRQGCRVTGVEYVPAMAEMASQWCEHMVVADLDGLDFDTEFAGQRFDVIVAADVLEHLRDPGAVLQRLPALLEAEGRLVISIPNVAYAGVIAGLAGGRFTYREKGLLDRTHLRFFTRRDAEWLLLGNGWLPVMWDAYRVPLAQSEFLADWLRLGDGARESLNAGSDADVYQYIVSAVPARESGFAQRNREHIRVLEEAGQAAEARLAERIEHHQRDLDSLRECEIAFSEARDLLAERDATIAGLHSTIAEQRSALDEQGSTLADRERRLEDLLEATRLFQRGGSVGSIGRARVFAARLLQRLARRLGGS